MNTGADTAPTEPRHARALATLITILLGTLAFAYAHGIEWMALVVWTMFVVSLFSLFSATSHTLALAPHRGRDLVRVRSTLRLKYVQVALAVGLLPVLPGLSSGVPWIEVTSSIVATAMSLMWIGCHFMVRARLFLPTANHASLRRRVTNRLLVDVSLYDTGTYVATTAIVVLALWLPMTAWKVAAAHVPIPAPNDFLPLLPDEIEDVTAAARPTPSASPPPADPAATPSDGAATPSATASISWEVVCRVDPSEIFGRVHSDQIAAALERAWLERGANEIGCPSTVNRSGKLYVVELHGGQSDPSLVISDARAHAAVVFDNLVSRVRQLLSSGTIVGVSERFSHGLGDSQIVDLVGSRCLFITRATYDSPYILVPPAATSVLINESSTKGEFPLVLAKRMKSGTVAVDYRFEGDRLDDLHTIVVSNEETDRLDKPPISERTCGNTSTLMALAGRLEGKVADEAAE